MHRLTSIVQRIEFYHTVRQLQQLESNSKKARHSNKPDKDTHDPKKPREVLRFLPRNFNIHPKQPSHQMQGHKYGRKNSHLAQSRVDIQAQPQVIDTKLGKELGLGPGDDLVDMRQVRHGRDQVVLHVTQVHDQVAFGKHGVLVFGLAPLDEGIEDVVLPVETADQLGNFLAQKVDARDQEPEVVRPCDEYLVFDGFGFTLG